MPVHGPQPGHPDAQPRAVLCDVRERDLRVPVLADAPVLTKQWRGLATRYDKLAITYRAAIILAACITWTRIWET